MKRFLLFLLLFSLPLSLRAQEQTSGTAIASTTPILSGVLEATPSILDEKAKARDILRFDIVLKNGAATMASVYPTVNDISMTEGQQEFIEPSLLDRKVSLASWMTIGRGVKDIPSGQEVKVSLEIKVDLSATPGKRFAQIAFPSGSNRTEAEAKVKDGNTPKVLVNIDVEEEIVERAQIKDFKTSKNTYIRYPVDFTLELENFGNRQINPQGNIMIFNRRGEEVANFDINGNGERIEPETSKKLFSAWTDGRGFGKYKAKLEIEYGSKDKRDLQDTIYFWVFPLPLLIMFAVITFVLILVISIILFKKTYHHLPHTPSAHHQAGPTENNGVINLREK